MRWFTVRVEEAMEMRRILVVDDDPVARAFVRAVLTSSGYEVLEAADGQEALDLFDRLAAAHRRPALVITDIEMPVLDGIGLLTALRQVHGPVPMVVITGVMRLPVVPHDVRLLPKPFSQEALLTAVQAALPLR